MVCINANAECCWHAAQVWKRSDFKVSLHRFPGFYSSFALPNYFFQDGRFRGWASVLKTYWSRLMTSGGENIK